MWRCNDLPQLKRSVFRAYLKLFLFLSHPKIAQPRTYAHINKISLCTLTKITFAFLSNPFPFHSSQKQFLISWKSFSSFSRYGFPFFARCASHLFFIPSPSRFSFSCSRNSGHFMAQQKLLAAAAAFFNYA